MREIEFNTYVYDSKTEEEIDVTIVVTNYYAGCAATYYEPAEDAELEYNVFPKNGGDCILHTLSDDDRYYLNEKVWDYVESYYAYDCDGDY